MLAPFLGIEKTSSSAARIASFSGSHSVRHPCSTGSISTNGGFLIEQGMKVGDGGTIESSEEESSESVD